MAEAVGGPGEAQEARRARPRGRRRRDHVGHVGAHVGRHVAGGDGSWRAHGYSGALVRGGGAITQLTHNCAPLFNRLFSQHFLRVGLCPTRFLPVQDAWRPTERQMRSGRRRSHGPESTRSSNHHVCKRGDTCDTQKAYLTPRDDTGIAYLHQHEGRAIFITRPR